MLIVIRAEGGRGQKGNIVKFDGTGTSHNRLDSGTSKTRAVRYTLMLGLQVETGA